MDEIIKSIKEAEERAALIKAEAEERAAVIYGEAEKQAIKIAAENEAECKTLKNNAVKKAEAEAARLYRDALNKKSAEAKAYADKLSETLDGAVSKVVRRVTSGSC